MNNKIPEYEIKYSKIKNIYIQIKNGKITVKAPKRVSKKEIEKIVEQKTEWIQKTKRCTDRQGGTIHEMDDRIGYTRIGILLP